MTTTSSLPFPTMEVPLMDDTMEMASPYQGHADDFDIDIDVMEDQASNADRDMAVADEYIDNSLGDDNQGQDGFPDEDMIDDDVPEPSMIDAEDYPETNQNIDMQYEGKTDEERKTYEAEMLEDEYDEDIDAPVPEHEDEVPASVEQADSEEIPSTEKELHEGNNKNIVEHQPEEGTQPLHETEPKLQPDSEPAAESLAEEQPVEKTETTQLEPQYPEETTRNTNEAEKVELQTMHNRDEQDTSEDLHTPEKKDGDSNHAQPSNDAPNEAEVEVQEEQHVSDSDEQEDAQEHDSTESPHLHPVKVYYQDNDISLFPPMAGDSSETFFLEDEGLAYESFGKLFVACREVLQDHINENEVLVIDIETLNLQLTEDSLETQTVTLKQIVDVYLRLCHNDGIEEPEALYLTLSTKLTVAAGLSDLLLAASEGKGLSEIESWDVYPDAEGASVEYEDVPQEPYPEEPEEPQSVLDNKGDEENLEDPEVEPTSHDQDTHNPQQDDLETQENHRVKSTEPGEVAENSPESEARPESLRSASHHSDEQRTESTGTLEPLPASEERLEPGEVDEHSYDGENNEDEYHYGDEPEDDPFVHAADSFDDLEEPGADLTEEHPEEYHDLESEYHEQPPSGEDINPDSPQNNEGAPANDSHPQDNPKTTEPHLDETSPNQSHQTQHVVDDSLGVAEDSLENHGDDSKAVDQLAEIDNTNEPGEIDETAEREFSLPAENDEEADLPFEDEEDYLDLGIADDLGGFAEDQDIATASHVSSKRVREADDELDLPESTTPEAKRSRSS